MEINNTIALNINELRAAIQEEYRVVAQEPEHGFHFHTGLPLAQMLEYKSEWLEGIPLRSLESFAGTGNPFFTRLPAPGEHVVDVGSGAGFDSLISARSVGPTGQVVGVDMTPAMLEKARRSKDELGLDQLRFEQGYAEDLPVPSGWADLVTSNGVLNLTPNKTAAVDEWARVLKPDGRLQVGDILVAKPVPQGAKDDIALWTG